MTSVVASDSIPAPCAAPGRRRGAHRAGPGDDDDDETPIGDPPDDEGPDDDEDDDEDEDDEDPLQFVNLP